MRKRDRRANGMIRMLVTPREDRGMMARISCQGRPRSGSGISGWRLRLLRREFSLVVGTMLLAVAVRIGVNLSLGYGLTVFEVGCRSY